MADGSIGPGLLLLSATDEDLQVTEDWLREQGRHDEANRLMGFRRFEPLLRKVAAAHDARDRVYAENGGFRARGAGAKRRQPAIEAVCSAAYAADRELQDLIWEVFGTEVPPWRRTRARELGKDDGPTLTPSEEEK